ncbi:aldehyde ferredoxin oxidoreductase family protein [Chloroflexota bacterium]
MGKVLFVDLSQGKIKVETPDESLYRQYLGGYGLGARILFSRQKAGVDPLGPDNTLGFVTGLLTGTAVPTGNRYAVVAKSPLTGGWGDANSGGDFGPYLKFSGYDAVFFSGVSEKPVYLAIKDGKAELRDASHLWGKGTYETEDMIQDELGKDMRVACIGPAGEKLSLISCIINNKGRAAGRSGLGAVMGSKKLKAIAVYGKAEVPVADKTMMDELRKKYLAGIKDKRIVARLSTGGTFGGNMGMLAKMGGYTRNWAGRGGDVFTDLGESYSQIQMTDYQEGKYGCWRCPIVCGGHMKAGTTYDYAAGSHKPEYETAVAFGPMCLNPDHESVIKLNDICNIHGIDTISAGTAIAFAMECYENGIITTQDTDGVELKWGDAKAMIDLIEKMAKREGFGDILADGSCVAAERIGKGAIEYSMEIDGQAIPFHDPKTSINMAVSYKIDPTPARHTQQGARSGIGEDQRKTNTACQAYNSAGLCFWMIVCMGHEFTAEFLTAVSGHNYDMDALIETGERISNMRESFNIREGINPVARHVPGRIIGVPPLTEGPVAGKTVDMDNLVADYLKAMDWDLKTGRPSRNKLEQLGLADIVEELYK